jgi:hypothetical protein
LDRSTRYDAISIARTFVWKKNPSLEELEFAKEQLPPTGYKADGIRRALERRIAAIKVGKDYQPF